MEKIAIISDIHGNLPALEAVLLDIERRGIKRIICLGDLVGKGPDSAAVVDRIKEVCESVVQGNWDLGLLCRRNSQQEYGISSSLVRIDLLIWNSCLSPLI